MIKLSVKGLADYMTASQAKQRQILRDFKYPDGDEAFAKRMYYREARANVVAYHAKGHDREWLRSKADALAARAAVGGASGRRLRHNSRALRQYEDHFASRRLQVEHGTKLGLVYGDVRISIVPDIVASERGRRRLIKLDFSADEPNADAVRIIAQCMYEAARREFVGLRSSSVLYVDVARGTERRGARAGSRTLREIEAACQNIAAIWTTL